MLELENLSFSYGEKAIIEHFSYRFQPGIPYLLYAESGGGKSTLLHLIAGLYRPTSGRIVGGGLENVAYAFQDPRLFPSKTALQNAGVSTDEATAAAFLTHFGFSREDMEKRPASLSGGMRQRVSLARAFLANKPVLLLDEPTKGLDDHLKDLLAQKIRETAKTRIVIAVSHEREDALCWNAIMIPLPSKVPPCQ